MTPSNATTVANVNFDFERSSTLTDAWACRLAVTGPRLLIAERMAAFLSLMHRCPPSRLPTFYRFMPTHPCFVTQLLTTTVSFLLYVFLSFLIIINRHYKVINYLLTVARQGKVCERESADCDGIVLWAIDL
jgi:hypothetical protein